MSEREKILRYYRDGNDAEIAARLTDLAENSVRSRKYRVSEFLDPNGYSIAETIAAHYDRISIEADGGFAGAERVKVAFIEEDFMGSVEFGIAALEITVDVRYYQISHRDVLGAVLGLGLKRELIGDIIMGGRGCQIVCETAMAEFISNNLTTIGAAAVEIQPLALNELASREERVKEIRNTAASLRLDVIAAMGFGTSRSKMASEITADKVKLNWKVAKSASQSVKAGDIISMRGRGRVELTEVLGQTKKGRISVLLKRFI
ncbi:MAG: RNA-binding domain protein [Firmicutes bacterium]|nr:RNA-binding domain protein [Bacillota bacterium]